MVESYGATCAELFGVRKGESFFSVFPTPRCYEPDILTIQPASVKVWRTVTYSNRMRYYSPDVGTIYILDLVRNGGYVWHYENRSHLRFLL